MKIELSFNIGETLELKGWINHIRSSGKLIFIDLRYLGGYIQLIVEKNNVGENVFDELKGCGIESSIQVNGIVGKHPKFEQYEIHVQEVNIINKTNDYPIGQKEHGTEFLFDNRHLHLRSKTQWAIQRVRNTIIQSTYEWMRNNEFIKIDSPIITPNACEGTTELFAMEYVNGEEVYLSQSGQLYLEAAIAAHTKVFDFGPVFRAEKSKTRRHLNEFWMMDAEMAFCDHEANLEIQEDLISFILTSVLDENLKELEMLDKDIEVLKSIKRPFIRTNYVEIVEELQKMGSDIKVGEDLGADDETMIMNKYSQPVFVQRYPKEVKSFYMKDDPDNPGYVLCADLLAPEGVGEIIGGSQREDDYNTLLNKIKSYGLPIGEFNWYLDTRKYGSVPHSGFGYGLERIVRWLCGIRHIRESIPFPRTLTRIRP